MKGYMQEIFTFVGTLLLKETHKASLHPPDALSMSNSARAFQC